MNVVGRVGSLISQGVYSVATPFHPFGGAVDIIAVEQEDGTFRSMPWYVCFGKFQGVLKTAEKVVTVSVNGVEADFHMYLDNSGRAYFMREVVSGEEAREPPDAAGTEHAKADNYQNGGYVESKGDRDNEKDIEREELSSPASSSGYGAFQYESLNEVEDMVKSSDEANSEMVLVSVDGHVLTAPFSSNQENSDDVQLSTPQFHLGPGEGSSEEFGGGKDVWEVGYFGELDESMRKDIDSPQGQLDGLEDGEDVTATVHVREVHNPVQIETTSSSENMSPHLSKDNMFKSCLDLTEHAGDRESFGTDSLYVDLAQNDDFECPTEKCSLSTIAVAEGVETQDGSNFNSDASQPVSPDIKDTESNICVNSKYKDDHVAGEEGLHNCDSDHLCRVNSTSAVTDASEEKVFDPENNLNEGSCSAHSGDIPCRSPPEENCSRTVTPRMRGSISGMGFDISLCGNLIRRGMGRTSAEEVFDAHIISEEEFRESGLSIIKNANLIVRYEDRYFKWDKVAHIIVGKSVYGSHFSVEPNDSICVDRVETPKAGEDPNRLSSPESRRWRLWSIPFRRAKSLEHSNSSISNEDIFVDSESGLQNISADQTSNRNNQSPRKQYLQTNIPTTEQIASLNLKEGQNKIAFSFSTRVLGKQEVDAHIYLWKWNARIVISDVDGTITKSDVLGQFMPLVGKDWTQSGVAHLFSAIKENGYQLLFLSARAIVQAYLTRSFLLNLKQDGKALPSGPVVISPDGLFPSLYREVIRRAPHEFKIACLEDIRALFPSDYNPFYAGFGNRDTDELSYRKIGIPKGKIFIINPKGEVAINHCIDVKSYTSLHTLVNDMFPPTSLVEQEDYNSWNYWRMPLPNIDC